MRAFGAAFCRGVEPFLANLKALIDAANAAGLEDDPEVVTAQAVYDDIREFVIYTPWGGADGDCARHTREVINAIARIQPLVPGASVPRPDAEERDEEDNGLIPSVPTWTKFALFGVLGLAALYYLTPYIAPRRRQLAGRNRR